MNCDLHTPAVQCIYAIVTQSGHNTVQDRPETFNDYEILQHSPG